jgi:hypothetical protein
MYFVYSIVGSMFRRGLCVSTLQDGWEQASGSSIPRSKLYDAWNTSAFLYDYKRNTILVHVHPAFTLPLWMRQDADDGTWLHYVNIVPHSSIAPCTDYGTNLFKLLAEAQSMSSIHWRHSCQLLATKITSILHKHEANSKCSSFSPWLFLVLLCCCLLHVAWRVCPYSMYRRMIAITTGLYIGCTWLHNCSVSFHALC